MSGSESGRKLQKGISARKSFAYEELIEPNDPK